MKQILIVVVLLVLYDFFLHLHSNAIARVMIPHPKGEHDYMY